MIENLLSYGWLIAFFALWVGLSVGSFLNVVIYRFPIMLERAWRADFAEIEAATAERDGREPPADVEPDSTAEERFNLSFPNSHCPACDTPIRAWQNIPIVSWLLLRGKCAACGVSISARYPAVELLTGVLTLVVVAVFGYGWLTLGLAIYTWILIAATFIDADTQLLPDQLTLPLLWLALLINLSFPIVPLADAVVGAMAGYLSLWTIYWLFKLVTGKEGMGYGDFKLLAAIGALVGWQVLPAVVLIASIAGLLFAIIRALLGEKVAGQPMAFGPFLAVGGWVALIARDNLLGLLS
ncbi:MAG: A24 family peptidase [Pseudomonadaceae bacterium]|nr:A24 family peptidase [Pseudomonadaceae bacterium]